jgi:hypothetical protein
MAKRIGEILVLMGTMKPEQIESVLAAQRAGDKRLFGTIALFLGFIEDNALRRYADYMDEHKEGTVWPRDSILTPGKLHDEKRLYGDDLYNTLWLLNVILNRNV